MVRIQPKGPAHRSRCVPDVDAGYTAIYEDAIDMAPNLVEFVVHERESRTSIAVVDGCSNILAPSLKAVIPHLYHGIWRRGHYQGDAF